MTNGANPDIPEFIEPQADLDTTPSPESPSAPAPDEGATASRPAPAAGPPSSPGLGLPPDEDDDTDDNRGLLPLLRRPAECPPPPATTRLKGVVTALLANPQVCLDEDAARTVASGVVDPTMFRALVQVPERGPMAGVNLLADKPVTGGTLFATAIHRRYVDDAVVPDLRNGRWGHLIHTWTDMHGTLRPVGYRALTDPDGRPLTVLTLHVRDRAELAEAARTSLTQTLTAGSSGSGHGAANDYTDSVMQQGVKEPLLLFVLRVTYDNGTEESFLMAGDGNSRLVSLWKARTGGNSLDAAAAALVRNVLGESDTKPRDPKRIRAAIASMSERINRGLGERILTEQTIREGHTATVPAVVIVGMASDDPAKPVDLVAAKDDLVAGLHVNTTPWQRAARYDQGMHHVLRSAVDNGLISDPALIEVLEGTADIQTMSQTLDLPPHPLWAAATWVEQMTGKARWDAVRPLFRQAFSLAQAQRKPVGERLGVVALAPFRSRTELGVDRALNAFADGGPLTDQVLYNAWSLTRGGNPQKVLDTVLYAALRGDESARCELTVLGGIAAMLTGLLSRDRGSKEGTERDAHHTPYRRTPYRLLEDLAASDGGLRTLHSIASSFVRADGSLPKQFDTAGAPVMDRAGAQVSVDYEWDLFAIADPDATDEALKRGQENSNSGQNNDQRPEDEKLRASLQSALKEATKAIRGLARLAQAGGNTVMGTPDFVQDSRTRAEAIRDLLTQFAPITRGPLLDDEDDEDDDEGSELFGGQA